MTVTLPELGKPSQTLKIRLLPGKPAAIKLVSFTDGFNKIEGENGKVQHVFVPEKKYRKVAALSPDQSNLVNKL